MRSILIYSILLIIQITVSAQEYIVPVENNFEAVKVAGNIHLQLVASDSSQLVFEGDRVPDKLDIEWAEDGLTLKTPIEFGSEPAITLKLYYRTLSELEVRRSAVVQSADILKTKILSVRAETGGKIELEIATDSISARVNQGADIILSGKTRCQLINAYTVGNYLAYELKAQKTWVTAATGAQVKINSTGLLDANATSKAFVGYLGNPEQKVFKYSVGGEISQQSQ
jgi:hypothetical protein